jgi:hypothetical protein
MPHKTLNFMTFDQTLKSMFVSVDPSDPNFFTDPNYFIPT